MALLLGVYGLVGAQENGALLSDPDKDKAKLEGSVPPPSVTWVPEDYITLPGSFRKGSGVPIDTLDVGDSYLQIILRDDFTWSYVKNMKKVAESDVFRECWVENILNPYANVQLSDLGYRNTICLIDSVSTFVCPYVGKVYSRFGYRRGRRHQGTDVPLTTGTPVKSAFDGRVRYAHRTSGYG
ncbi:MAG: M23 family metallopeptidase, partial [Candidatus Cryptobacteroides sp.]|nr:M23 family metallopeptidase [Bacteroidales bacterium]MDY6157982.1 M23 family metallopeptidase [Candidatus Cryptobacteroides sp.]